MQQLQQIRPMVWTALVAVLLVSALGVWRLVDNTSSHTELRVGLYENEPKVFTNARGEPDGLFVDLLNDMAEQEGWQLDYVPCVWTLCLEMLARGDLDLMPDVAFTAGRAQQFSFHQQPVVQSWSQIYATTGSGLIAISDLLERSVAVVEGSVQEAFLQGYANEQGGAIDLILVDSFSAGFAAVEAGQADAAVANNFYGNRHRGDFNLIDTPITFDQVGLYYATPAGAGETLLAAIDQRLAEWLSTPNSPYYTALSRAIAPAVSEVLPAWFLWLALGLLALVTVLALLVYGLRWTVQRRTEQLSRANDRFEHLLDGSPVVVYALTGRDLTLSWVSSNVNRVFGFTPDDMLQPGWWQSRLHPKDRSLATSGLSRILTQEHTRRDYRILDQQGKVRYVRDEQRLVQPGTAGSAEDREVIGTWTDVTHSREQEARVSYLNHYDVLTGLPNRRLLLDRLDHAIKLADGQGYSIALLFIDLDRFKTINDAQGITAGDRILREMAERIRRRNPLNTLARLSADEFLLVIERPPTDARLHHLIAALLADIKRSVELQGHSIMVTASVGVSQFPQDGNTAESMVTQAELAMVEAKRQGGDTWRYYDQSLRQQSEANFKLENALRHAVSRNELRLWFQPQYQLASGQLMGAEALVRWQHPEMGMIPPDRFIPLAETIGIIQEIDAWVMNEACRQIKAWRRRGLDVPKVAVNISVADLENVGLRDAISNMLETHDVAPSQLVLEVTESMVMQAPDCSAAMLTNLKELGISIAIDDFGTGYSNLISLHQLPLDCLKIDQSFVRNIGSSKANESITQAIIAMASALNLELVAEGIETEAQKAFLIQSGCANGQGYLLSRPITADKLLEQELAVATSS